MDLRPTIFLDTNVLQYIFSYLRYAKGLKLPPYGARTEEKTRGTLNRKLPRGIVDDIMNGAKALAFLQQQVQNQEAVIYTSRFAKAEILCGSLEGQAHARLAREGTTYRMRQRRGTLSELVSMYLEPSTFKSIVCEWDDMLSLLGKGGIRIDFAEDVENFRQIADIAEFIQSKVFVDVLDGWMYGCALVVQAEQIITCDGYFRKLINRLANPSGDKGWTELRRELLDRLREAFGDMDTGIEISLPLVRDLPRDVPAVWRLDHA